MVAAVQFGSLAFGSVVAANLACCHALRAFRGSKPILEAAGECRITKRTPLQRNGLFRLLFSYLWRRLRAEIGGDRLCDVPADEIGHAACRTSSGAWRSQSKKGEERAFFAKRKGPRRGPKGKLRNEPGPPSRHDLSGT